VTAYISYPVGEGTGQARPAAGAEPRVAGPVLERPRAPLGCPSIANQLTPLHGFWEYFSMRPLRSCLTVVGLFALERHRELVRA